MRDPRAGTFGVVSLVCVVALKIAAVDALPSALRPQLLVLGPALGRWAIVLLATLFPYGRADGLGAPLKGAATPRALALASVCPRPPAFWSARLAWLSARSRLLTALALGRWLMRLLPGLTGDCYGAVCEVVETLVWLSAAPLARSGLAPACARRPVRRGTGARTRPGRALGWPPTCFLLCPGAHRYLPGARPVSGGHQRGAAAAHAGGRCRSRPRRHGPLPGRACPASTRHPRAHPASPAPHSNWLTLQATFVGAGLRVWPATAVCARRDQPGGDYHRWLRRARRGDAVRRRSADRARAARRAALTSCSARACPGARRPPWRCCWRWAMPPKDGSAAACRATPTHSS